MQKHSLKKMYGNKFCLLFLISFLLGQMTFAQNEITGTITDANGMVIPGVSVLEKGTTNGAQSDFNGTYVITVNDGATLLFYYLGFITQEVVVKEQNVINVTLEENVEALGEVVVIGYGTQKREDVNSAISSVNAEDLEDLQQVNVDQMLQGKVSGVTIKNSSGAPGANASVNIRGITSISGSSEPLYIIDGVPISGDATNGATTGRTIAGTDFTSQGNIAQSPMSMINPNDIESIDVLKDASATAIYGSRGANGVIIITTKSGKKGAGKVSYETFTSFHTIPKLLDAMNLREYAVLQNALAEIYGQTPRSEFAQPQLLGEGTDWQEEISRSPALVKSHQLSFSGGGEDITYYLSGGFLDQQGTLIGSGFKRYSVKLNLNAEVKPWLKVGANLSGTITNQDILVNSNYNGVLSNTLNIAPDIPVRNLDGSFAGPPAGQAVSYFNPVAVALSNDNKLIRKNFFGNIYAEANIFNGLKYRVEIAANTEFSENNEFFPAYQWGTTVNDEADLNTRRQNWYSTNFKNLLTYDKAFGKHRVTVLAGNEINDTRWEGLVATATGFVSNDIQTISVADAERSTVTDYKGSQGILSFFGRAIYDFDNRYSLTASYRADGSSKFDPNGEGKQWGYFPSLAFGWKLSNEAFMKDVEFIENIKFNVGYGETGNSQIPNNQYSSTLSAFGSGLGTGFLLDNIPNPDLTWESQQQTNIGVGFSLFNSNLTVDFDVYEKKSKDFLFRLPLPLYLTGGESYEGGISSPIKNLGSMRNRGFDLELNYKMITEANFSWNSSFNISHYKNEVTSIPNGLSLTGDINTNGFINLTATNTVEGQPIGMFFGYITDGLFRNLDELNSAPTQFGQAVGEAPGETYLGDVRYRDISGPEGVPDGVIDENDRTFIGSPHPDFTFGFTNNFRYKGLDLSLSLQGSYGNDLLNLTRRSGTTNSTLYQNQLSEAIDFWTPENVDASLPRPIASSSNPNINMSDRYLEDGSYLRIQNLTLGYSLPTKVISRLSLSRLRVYGTVQNLYTFTNYKGYDPEVGSVNQNPFLNGIDNGRYPSARSVSLGINLEF